MKFYTKQHPYYCGVDLHADAMYVCILDATGEVVVHQNIPTRPKAFLRLIKPYRAGLVVGCECMFTWYWLADLCADEGIDFVLGHALYMRAIHSGKAKNDKIDSHKIAVLLRGGSFPLAYAYPRKMRAARDLLRRRNHLARKRAELFSHIQNTATQYNLPEPLGCIAKPNARAELPAKFRNPLVRAMVELDLATIEHYDDLLGILERDLEKVATGHNPVNLALLKSIPGVGRILGMVMLYEIEDIARFAREQDFSSYCRLVRPEKQSNGKSYGHSGKKIGNAHLRWAFGEAVVLMLKGNPPAQATLQRLASKHGKGKALAILAHRLGRAVYYMLKNQVPFDQKRFLRLST
ncbi:IS110 family transposase [Geoalkalibacter halelectricus]|uniref:IS110 family transposase n=1 Tax=Geoalkalibacter halelectricus TaxID=2847045 RepID=A0ABY5ZNS6_9BACT|nr:IS110 family transposase [Geoalkalibacter halelectricus]MDO3380267.1 IS110 family transposase [Geoalkalibacter halelectricus]UWZ79535.1 IS110 family transposase [Geoalkalibacter halelectricus]